MESCTNQVHHFTIQKKIRPLSVAPGLSTLVWMNPRHLSLPSLRRQSWHVQHTLAETWRASSAPRGEELSSLSWKRLNMLCFLLWFTRFGTLTLIFYSEQRLFRMGSACTCMEGGSLFRETVTAIISSLLMSREQMTRRTCQQSSWVSNVATTFKDTWWSSLPASVKPGPRW